MTRHPASVGQESLWLQHQLHRAGQAAYNDYVVFAVEGELRCDLLNDAVVEIVTRHEVLRTRLVPDTDTVCQLVSVAAQSYLRIMEWQDTARDEAIDRLTTHELRRPFDLERELPFRFVVVRCAGDETLMSVVFHHIVADSRSVDIFVTELSSIYTDLLEGRKASLPPLACQYHDYARWQRAWLDSTSAEQQLEYWHNQLAGLESCAIHSDRERGAEPTGAGAVEVFEWGLPLLRRVKRVSREESVTPFVMTLAALTATLSRWARCPEICVGVPTTQRRRTEWEPLIGYFVNMVAIRVAVGSTTGGRRLLDEVRNRVVDAMAHQDAPFERVVARVRPERDLGWHPLFQVSFSLLQQTMRPVQFPGLRMTRLRIPNQTTRFDLGWNLWQDEEAGLKGRVLYSAELFDARTIGRIIEGYHTVLSALTSAPTIAVSSIPLADARELHRHRQSPASKPWAGATTVHGMFEAQAERTPEAHAIAFESRVLTYRELDRHANVIANRLRLLGVGPEVRVGIALQRSAALMVGVLGVLKAGGAYVPIDPEYPGERVGYMLRNAGIRVLLTEAATEHKLPRVDVRTVRLDLDSPDEVAQASAHPYTTGGAQLAYAIYTSGSTGQPKGAALPHRGVCNYLAWLQRTYPLSSSDSVLQKTAFSFDGSILELFWPLVSGARLVLACPGLQYDTAYLLDVIERERITILKFVPSMLRVFLNEMRGRRCPSVRHVFCGGEAMTRELLAQFSASFDAALHNTYGATETSVNSIVWDCDPNDRAGRIPLGTPIDHTPVYVCDEQLQMMPDGACGEICIGGPGVGRGYLEDPSLTAQKFVSDPFNGQSGARMYRTGDLGRYTHDGRLEFLGRLDHQVKVFGNRIELGEIETVARCHPSVAMAAATVYQTSDGTLAVGCVVVRAAAGDTGDDLVLEHELRRSFATKLPTFARPSVILIGPTLPITPSGKLDRSELRRRLEAKPDLPAAAPPRHGAPADVLRVWQDILGNADLRDDDDFFRAGGHSLLAVQAVGRLSAAFGVHIPLAAIFLHPTPRAMGEWLDEQRASLPSA